MPSKNGKLYGLTLLCPILDDDMATPSHDLQIRHYLANLPTDRRSPFALAPGTHLARLVVLDDVIYVGMPSCEEHLRSKYLVFESNLDAASDGAPHGGLDAYLTGLATSVPTHLNALWSHCVGYPGTANLEAFLRYMRSCQIETTFFFAAVNDRTLPETLRALQTQRAVADFIAHHQGVEPARLQQAFQHFAATLQAAPLPAPGSTASPRKLQLGGRNE